MPVRASKVSRERLLYLHRAIVPDLASHPFDRLYRAGVTLSVNSDDPPFFDTTLSEEFLRLHRTFGYSAGVMRSSYRSRSVPSSSDGDLGFRCARSQP